MGDDRERFLARWSRLKEQDAKPEPCPDQAQPAVPAIDPGAAPPQLPPLEELTIESDFRGFFHPKVDEGLRRAALRKLFGDPHFNLMDGLDVYIDDYSKSDPLPADMLAKIRHAQQIFAWAKESKEESAERYAVAPAAVVPPALAEQQAPPQPAVTQPAGEPTSEVPSIESPAPRERES